MPHQVDAYATLLQQVRNDLQVQHPEWVQPNGQCPMCDCYEARLIELLQASKPGESNGRMVTVSEIPILPNPKNSRAPIFS